MTNIVDNALDKLAASMEMFHACREAGINFFDSANVYSKGRSEEILGKCIKDCRDEVVITSKVFGTMGDNINAKGLSRRHMMLAVEDSLRRLGTDRIDFYFLHSFDSKTAIEETLRTLDDLQKQGKILYPAVSNWAAWQISKALGISERQLLARFELIQPMYNLVKRQAEVEILPMAEAEQVGVISYSPLGGGLLTGKYNGESAKSAQGRLNEMENYAIRYGEARYHDTAAKFTTYAQEKGYNPVSLAVSWGMSHPAITAPIIGARNVNQLQPSLEAANINMTTEWRDEISALSAQPPLATDR